jgi:hypothetical protein
MTSRVTRTKVEILFDAPLVDAVREIVVQAGASGHTLLPVLGGSGRSGQWNEDRISAADSKVLLLTIVNGQTAERIVRGLEPLLDSHGMIVITSSVGVVREARF